MSKLSQNDFHIKNSNISFFANSMECSVSFISKIDRITCCLSNILSNKANLVDFIGNTSCRYCGRMFGYKSLTIWVGVYFNNIVFTSEHQFVLGIYLDEKNNDVLTKLKNAGINFKLCNFEPVEEKWIFITLDNFLLTNDCNEIESEILRILNSIK